MSLKKDSKYIFVDPFNIGHIAQTTKSKKNPHERMEERANYLAEELARILPNQFALVPCNVG